MEGTIASKRIEIRDLLQGQHTGAQVTAMGWVRNKRESKNVFFFTLNDGSCLQALQVVADPAQTPEEVLRKISVGAALAVSGQLVASQGKGQSVELQATDIRILGEADPEKYPLQPKKHSLEFLREIAHLRMRTNTFGAIFRIRHHLQFAIHQFFNERGFFNLHTPIITASDAEGAGEMFQVTTLDLKNPPRTPEGEIDYKQDFFERSTNLTVSGQLEGELGALALGKIYTFGPTFRAENSNTSRHLAEFWMIEPEMAFYELEDNMDLAEDMLKYVIRYALEHCAEDLEFLAQRAEEEEKQKPQQERSEMGLLQRLQFVLEHPFERLSYTEAIEILRNSQHNRKKKFQYLIEAWGTDLQSEHERYLVEKHFKKPVILYNYPAAIKSFYMRLNEDGKTVGAMDILFPGIGEIVGGSQREERYQELKERAKSMGIEEEAIAWYLETRQFGTVPHSGFGLGFERLMLFVTGMTNIRDVIAFPRFPGSAEF
ncbi:asparagine--tRNA ligase [Cesiribacter andamanensis]|uniref:Asparagine--tRNA ligase n=1 Tax=Cesiribacter andamanensis AMV16 TaxID=1279009 RepID=M7N0Q1_9BACT|nr:asparagine--tRNA ligase [Cesiribacter andamanensis]EMR00776.1 Asparagine--tRNA ligase [Cesiribacter andamanensis AMV16]